jgi:hypothetical protein
MPLMGIVDYATHRNCAVNAVVEAIAAGRISVNESNLIDVAVADQDWDGSTFASLARPSTPVEIRSTPVVGGGSPGEPAKKKATVAVPGITFADARALREVYDAQKRELDLAIKRGELVRVVDVQRQAFGLYRAIRDTVFAVPARVAAQLAAETDEAVVRDVLEAELAAIFDSFAEKGKVA